MLRMELHKVSKKLEKTEKTLDKSKAMLKEVGTIKEDLINLKHTAEEAEDFDGIIAENEILKAKVSDL
jgi:hypothetical protein